MPTETDETEHPRRTSFRGLHLNLVGEGTRRGRSLTAMSFSKYTQNRRRANRPVGLRLRSAAGTSFAPTPGGAFRIVPTSHGVASWLGAGKRSKTRTGTRIR